MHVKRFEAADMAEALRLVKFDLGQNAIILSTRQVKKGSGAFGIFGRSFVEVTAAVDREAVEAPRPEPQARSLAAAPARATTPDVTDMTRVLDPIQRDVEAMKDLLQQLALKDRLAPPVNLHGLEREFTVMKRMVEQLVRQQQDSAMPLFAATLMPCYQRLLASGMDETLARHLIEKAQNSLEPDKLNEAVSVQEHVAGLVMKSTPASGPLQATSGEPIIAAFVGPTGVGKTTTLAKLAAHYSLGDKR